MTTIPDDEWEWFAARLIEKDIPKNSHWVTEGQIAKIGCNDDQLGVRADFVSWSSQASMNAFANVLRARYSGVVEQNWSLRGDGVITGYTLEYRDESGQATIFWTYNSDTVSGHASWKDDDQTALNAWWKATGARLR